MYFDRIHIFYLKMQKVELNFRINPFYFFSLLHTPQNVLLIYLNALGVELQNLSEAEVG